MESGVGANKDGVQDKDMPREYVEEVYFAREPEWMRYFMYQ